MSDQCVLQPLPAGPWFPQPGEVGTAGFGVHKLNSIPHALNGKKLTCVNFKKFQEKKHLIAKKKKKGRKLLIIVLIEKLFQVSDTSSLLPSQDIGVTEWHVIYQINPT